MNEQPNNTDPTLSCPSYSASITLNCQNPFQLVLKQTRKRNLCQMGVSIFLIFETLRMLSSVSGAAHTVRIPWIELFFGAPDSHMYAYLHQHLPFDTIFNQVWPVTQIYNIVLQTKTTLLIWTINLVFLQWILCFVYEDCWKCRNTSFVTAKVLSDSAETKLEKQDNNDYISAKRQHENGSWKQITGRKNKCLLNKAPLWNFKQQVFWKMNLLNVEPRKLAEEKAI